MGNNEEEEGLSGKEEMTTGNGELRDLPESSMCVFVCGEREREERLRRK